MQHALTVRQKAALGLVVLVAGGLAAAGLAAVAARQGLGAGTVELTVGVSDASDLIPGTAVRIRGVEAGQVVAVEYPDSDGPGSAVTVRLRVPSKFAPRLFADATAQVQPTGLLGGRVVAVHPGTPAAGPLLDGRLKYVPTADLTQAAAKVGDLADEARKLLADVRAEDGLYKELKGLTADARQAVKKAEGAAATVEGEAAGVRQLVQDGRDTLKSVRQGTDAVQKLPIIRGYIEDNQALLVRPTFRRQAFSYRADDLFEPGTAILSAAGRDHLLGLLPHVKTGLDPKAEVVVSAGGEGGATAGPLTKQRADGVVAFLRDKGAHKMGWWSRRTMTAVGLGADPDPVHDPGRPAGPWVQVLIFTPA